MKSSVGFRNTNLKIFDVEETYDIDSPSSSLNFVPDKAVQLDSLEIKVDQRVQLPIFTSKSHTLSMKVF